MRISVLFLAAAILNVVITIGFIFYDFEQLMLSAEVIETLNYLSFITYLIILSFIAWIALEVDKNHSIVISIMILILFSLLSNFKSYILNYLDIEVTFQTAMIVATPTIVVLIYFIVQAFRVKNQYYKFYFRLIAWGFIVKFLMNMLLPLLLDLAGLASKLWLTDLLGILPVIAIMLLMIKSIKETPPRFVGNSILSGNKEGIILDQDL